MQLIKEVKEIGEDAILGVKRFNNSLLGKKPPSVNKKTYLEWEENEGLLNEDTYANRVSFGEKARINKGIKPSEVEIYKLIPEGAKIEQALEIEKYNKNLQKEQGERVILAYENKIDETKKQIKYFQENNFYRNGSTVNENAIHAEVFENELK